MATGPRERELRLALVLNGGVSLAIWIGGVTHEVDRLRREDGLYKKLLDLLGWDVRVDVLSGASAGGINGALLAAAIACDTSLPNLRDTWIRLGDLGSMARSPGESDPPSLFQGDDYALVEMRREFARLYSGKAPGKREDAGANPIHLFLTATDLHGDPQTFSDSTGRAFVEREHRIVFRFSDETEARPISPALPGPQPPLEPEDPETFPHRGKLRDDRAPELLARAARATSAFPGAFEPHRVTLQDRDGRARVADAIDGGVLDNQPFNPLLNQIALLPAGRPVRRIVGYIVPYVTDPETSRAGDGARRNADGEPPPPTTIFDSVSGALNLPRDLPKLDGLNRVRQEYRAATEAEQARRRAGAAIADGAMTAAAELLFDWYRAARSRAVLLALRETLRAAFEPGRGPAGGDETRDLDTRPPLSREEDPDHPPGDLPWLPPPDWDEAVAWEQGDWAWGLTPAERVAADAMGFLRDAIETVGPDDPERSQLEVARLQASALAAELRGMQELLRVQLRSTFPVGSSPSDGELIGAARTVYGSLPVGLVRERFSGLERELARLRRPSLPTVAELLAAEVVRNATAVDPAPRPVPFTFLHMSAGIGSSLGHTATTPDEKLAGMKLGHFGGFLKRSWRANDWLWGRLDGVEQLLRALAQAGDLTRLTPENRQRLAAFAFPGDDPARLAVLTGAWASRLAHEDVNVEHLRGATAGEQLEQAIVRIKELAPEDGKRPGADRVGPYLRAVRGALAARLELEILLEGELMRVAETALGDADEGSSPSAKGLRWARELLAGRPPDEVALSPEEAVGAFRRLEIGSEPLAAELGSPAGIRLFACVVPVGAAAVAGGRSGLPRVLRSGLALLRAVTYVLGFLVRLAVWPLTRRRSRAA